MKKFLIQIFLTFALFTFAFEVLLRVTDLAAHAVPKEVIDGNTLSKPFSEGYWIRGGLGEIRSHYAINGQGWNSILDYDQIEQGYTSVALLGDSYIKGLHVDVENSIGRLVEQSLPQEKVVVHEYGQEGGNLVDFAAIYKEFCKGKYDHIFILITNADVMATRASFMGVSGTDKGEGSWTRKLYDFSSLLRYLNINHGMSYKINRLIHEGPEWAIQERELTEQEIVGKVNRSTLQTFDKDVVFLYEEEKLSPAVRAMLPGPSRCVNHTRLPKDFGFDSHWNLNGRKNCADAIASFIQQDIEKQLAGKE